jgi:hypothetical protein
MKRRKRQRASHRWQFHLRSLLIVLAVTPPLLAGVWWTWVTFKELIALALFFVLPPLTLMLMAQLGPLLRWVFRERRQ